MGRYKMGPQGPYYDPNDSGPDQASADQIQQFQQSQTPAAPTQGGGYQPGNPPPYLPPTGGISGGATAMPMQPQTQPFPGDPNLPGYGDMNTSNPWRDSLTYAQMMQSGGIKPVSAYFQNGGAQAPARPGLGGIIGAITRPQMPTSRGGFFSGLRGSLGALGGLF